MTERNTPSFESLARRRNRNRRNVRRNRTIQRADRRELLNDVEVMDDGIGVYSYYPISGRVAKKL